MSPCGTRCVSRAFMPSFMSCLGVLAKDDVDDEDEDEG